MESLVRNVKPSGRVHSVTMMMPYRTIEYLFISDYCVNSSEIVISGNGSGLRDMNTSSEKS